MVNQLMRIMLIDDSEADNHYHRIVIEDAGVAESVESYLYADEALSRLRTIAVEALPNVIFLDINMPRMDGWEFIEQYAQLDAERRTGRIVAMVTTSSDPRNAQRAAQLSLVSHFTQKPLTVDTLKKLLELAG